MISEWFIHAGAQRWRSHEPRITYVWICVCNLRVYVCCECVYGCKCADIRCGHDTSDDDIDDDDDYDDGVLGCARCLRINRMLNMCTFYHTKRFGTLRAQIVHLSAVSSF